MTITCRIEHNDGGATLTTLTTDKGDEVKIYRWAHGDATIKFNPVQYDTNLHLPSKDDAVVFALNIAFALGADIAPNGPPPVEPDAWDVGQANWDAAIAAGYTADDINLSAVIANGPKIWAGFPEPTLWHRALDHFHLRFGVPTEVLAEFDAAPYDTTLGLLEAIKALADGSRP